MRGDVLNYPNDFDIKSFPAGKTIAFSRSVSIWISIAFFLIVALCGFVLLGIHLKKNYPFLISIDPFTDEWNVVTFPGKQDKETISQYQIVQEKMVQDFVTNWFTISAIGSDNNDRWANCSIEECANGEQFRPDNIKCALSCKADDKVFEDFSKNVLPEYQAREKASEKWMVGRMLITPTNVTETSGTWQVYTTIYSTISSAFNTLSFITIEQAQNRYPATLGYYIKTFNSYRLINE